MLPEREVRVIAAQVMAGLAYLNEAPRRIMCAPPVLLVCALAMHTHGCKRACHVMLWSAVLT